MGRYGLSKADLSRIMGISYRQAIKKINRKKNARGETLGFTVNETEKIIRAFNVYENRLTKPNDPERPKISVEALFFEHMFSCENAISALNS
jgi:hypothetical protein